MSLPRVLFLCTHNSARSQLAEALLRHDHGQRYQALSAGTEETRVKPEVLEVLAELGVDTEPLYSKTLDRFEADTPEYVVTVCDSAHEACPWFQGAVKTWHRPFPDPSNETRSSQLRLEAFRKTRDDIRSWLGDMFATSQPQDSGV